MTNCQLAVFICVGPSEGLKHGRDQLNLRLRNPRGSGATVSPKDWSKEKDRHPTERTKKVIEAKTLLFQHASCLLGIACKPGTSFWEVNGSKNRDPIDPPDPSRSHDFSACFEDFVDLFPWVARWTLHGADFPPELEADRFPPYRSAPFCEVLWRSPAAVPVMPDPDLAVVARKQSTDISTSKRSLEHRSDRSPVGSHYQEIMNLSFVFFGGQVTSVTSIVYTHSPPSIRSKMQSTMAMNDRRMAARCSGPQISSGPNLILKMVQELPLQKHGKYDIFAAELTDFFLYPVPSESPVTPEPICKIRRSLNSFCRNSNHEFKCQVLSKVLHVIAFETTNQLLRICHCYIQTTTCNHYRVLSRSGTVIWCHLAKLSLLWMYLLLLAPKMFVTSYHFSNGKKLDTRRHLIVWLWGWLLLRRLDVPSWPIDNVHHNSCLWIIAQFLGQSIAAAGSFVFLVTWDGWQKPSELKASSNLTSRPLAISCKSHSAAVGKSLHLLAPEFIRCLSYGDHLASSRGDWNPCHAPLFRGLSWPIMGSLGPTPPTWKTQRTKCHLVHHYHCNWKLLLPRNNCAKKSRIPRQPSVQTFQSPWKLRISGFSGGVFYDVFFSQLGRRCIWKCRSRCKFSLAQRGQQETVKMLGVLATRNI